MELILRFPELSEEEGTYYQLDRESSYYRIEKDGDLAVIRMNKSMLRDLAYEMMYFAEGKIGVSSHIHYDDFTCPKMQGDHELILCKDADDLFSLHIIKCRKG